MVKTAKGKPDELAAAEPEPVPGEWTIEVYEGSDGSCPFAKFLEGLEEYKRQVVDLAIRTVLKRQGHNVCGTNWGKQLGGGLYEFRIDKTLGTLYRDSGREVPKSLNAKARVLVRVFFSVEGDRIVLLLGGYDKGADTGKGRQGREIDRARGVLAEHLAMQRSQAKK